MLELQETSLKMFLDEPVVTIVFRSEPVTWSQQQDSEVLDCET